ncbi:MAG TPA: DUF4173 domain-containing protein, partial [Micromonosporaceae bacterium]|nr:DUF4173 domain-containing protein [Micromonosporaceae bacterium]
MPTGFRTPLAHSFWPRSRAGASTAVLCAAAAAALVGGIVLVPIRPGVGWLVTGVALAAVGLVATLRGTDPDPATPAPEASTPDVSSPAADSGDTGTGEPSSEPTTDPSASAADDVAVPAAVARAGVAAFAKRYGERVFWTAITLALLSVGTFRAAGWLYFWCFVAAVVTAAFGLAGGRTVKAMALGVLVSLGAPFMSQGWFARGWTQARRRRRTGSRAVVVVLICVGLVLVFGGLFAGADAEFRHLVAAVLPRLDAADITRGVLCFLLVLLIDTGVAHLAAARPTLDSMTPTVWRSVRRFEWVAPLAVLNVLFAVFDVVQLAVFFNPDRSLVTRSHDYLRGYAHEGFWQLLAVTLLTLTVLGVTARIAPREERTDRVWLRVLIGGMAVLSMVIVAAALKRLRTYEAVYGFTRLRVVAGGVALWLGVVFIFVLVASILLRAGWLPRVIAGSLAVALFAGAIANPDYYIAQHNIDR